MLEVAYLATDGNGIDAEEIIRAFLLGVARGAAEQFLRLNRRASLSVGVSLEAEVQDPILLPSKDDD